MRDAIAIEARDFEMLDMCLQHPDTHQDTLAGYVPKLLDKIDRMQLQYDHLKDGARELGHVVHEQNMDILHATRLQHLIDEDGDGDWQAVYECLAEMRPPARSLRTVADLQALPQRSIILDKDDVTYRLAPWGVKESTWYPLDGWDAFHRDFGVDIDDIALPATLLHEGEK